MLERFNTQMLIVPPITFLLKMLSAAGNELSSKLNICSKSSFFLENLLLFNTTTIPHKSTTIKKKNEGKRLKKKKINKVTENRDRVNLTITSSINITTSLAGEIFRKKR